ncbi:gamma-aminobutyric acid receptor subunit alpha-1-like isoform X2 [Penaeus monodon]|uniref:gamma-aminobutyric acid receptor subunit alpha-1-like isoform X2 n=1 Tax=Penaeus monodon TaxID=6687 RepID=UPI0018A7D390|nr:gamma-aminobutyric acid receptor subunit alpha-1-like isoform X2 [Penaeus monodon]
MIGGTLTRRAVWCWWWWRWWVLAILAATITSSEGFSSTYSASSYSKNVTSLLDSLLSDYDRRIRPGYGGPPTTIRVNMNVRSMGPFSEKQESYSMQLYLRQVWFDPRLRFNKTDLGKREFSMNWMFAARLWKPDTFFINGKNSYAHKITAPNTFIRLQHDGQITWSLRLTVRASCKMHLRKFPLDTQLCPLSLASYGYNATDIVYKWAPQLVTVDSDVSIAQYELVKITTNSTKVTVRRKEEISILSVKFHLKRLTGFFLLQVYVPCILIVCCSWVAFWITKKDVPGRVCLGATTVLSLTKIGFGGKTSMPKVSYPTSLDYFVILCFTFVFGAIVEYTMMHFLERSTNKRRKAMEQHQKEVEERTRTSEVQGQQRAAEKDATMMVTTTVKEDGVDIGSSLRETLKVPLTVVPLGVSAIDEEQEDEGGAKQAGSPTSSRAGDGSPLDTKSPLKEALKLPLSVVPGSLEAVREGGEGDSDGLRARNVSAAKREGEDPDSGAEGDRSVVSAEADAAPAVRPGEGWVSASDSCSVSSKSSLFRLRKDASAAAKKERLDSESDLTVIKVDIQADEEEEEPPPPRPYTVWQILTWKRKLMAEMSPANVIPSEEDVLDRFSVIDLYARRIFPTAFFILFTVYWVMFNYYITDEFPHETKEPSDGLVVV